MQNLITSLTLFLLPMLGLSQEWSQVGSDIYGQHETDLEGTDVDISADGSVIVTGAYRSEDTFDDEGQIRIFELVGSDWLQRGDEIKGTEMDEYFGQSVGLSADGNTVAGGSSGFGTGGRVRVFNWDGSSWNQVGSDILGLSAGESFGTSLCLSDDGNTVIISAPSNDELFSNAGAVRVFSWNGTDWEQKGSTFYGEGANDEAGYGDMDISPSGDIIFFGIPHNDEAASNAGKAFVYEWDGSTWISKGGPFLGDAADQGLFSTCMSNGGDTLALGYAFNTEAGPYSGKVRIYDWSGGSWNLIQDIVGSSGHTFFGSNLSFDNSGKTLGIGQFGNSTGGIEAGAVHIYQWDGTEYSQKGLSIFGDQSDETACIINLSEDGNSFVVGGDGYGLSGAYEGRTRVFEWINGSGIQTLKDVQSRIYPNPSQSNGIIHYNLPFEKEVTFTFFTIEGRKILQGTSETDWISLDGSGLAAGIYNVLIHSDLAESPALKTQILIVD